MDKFVNGVRAILENSIISETYYETLHSYDTWNIE